MPSELNVYRTGPDKAPNRKHVKDVKLGSIISALSVHRCYLDEPLTSNGHQIGREIMYSDNSRKTISNILGRRVTTAIPNANYAAVVRPFKTHFPSMLARRVIDIRTQTHTRTHIEPLCYSLSFSLESGERMCDRASCAIPNIRRRLYIFIKYMNPFICFYRYANVNDNL